jgi:hypothetical protein
MLLEDHTTVCFTVEPQAAVLWDDKNMNRYHEEISSQINFIIPPCSMLIKYNTETIQTNIDISQICVTSFKLSFDQFQRQSVPYKLLQFTQKYSDITRAYYSPKKHARARTHTHTHIYILLRVTWVASLFRGSLLGNSFVTRNKYWRSC